MHTRKRRARLCFRLWSGMCWTRSTPANRPGPWSRIGWRICNNDLDILKLLKPVAHHSFEGHSCLVLRQMMLGRALYDWRDNCYVREHIAKSSELVPRQTGLPVLLMASSLVIVQLHVVHASRAVHRPDDLQSQPCIQFTIVYPPGYRENIY